MIINLFFLIKYRYKNKCSLNIQTKMCKFGIKLKNIKMDEKKSFSEDAKGFLNMWKNDYADKNKDILDRKKQRDAETAALNEEIKKQFEEIKIDLSGKAKEIYEVLDREFKGFTTALKEGTATIAQKLEVEKRMEQLGTFLQATGDKSSAKINSIIGIMKTKLNSFDKEIVSEIETGSNENTKSDSITKLTDDANKLFDDIK